MFFHPIGPRISLKFAVPPGVPSIELGNAIYLLSQPPRFGARYNYTIPLSICQEIQQIFAEF